MHVLGGIKSEQEFTEGFRSILERYGLDRKQLAGQLPCFSHSGTTEGCKPSPRRTSQSRPASPPVFTDALKEVFMTDPGAVEGEVFTIKAASLRQLDAWMRAVEEEVAKEQVRTGRFFDGPPLDNGVLRAVQGSLERGDPPNATTARPAEPAPAASLRPLSAAW